MGGEDLRIRPHSSYRETNGTQLIWRLSRAVAPLATEAENGSVVISKFSGAAAPIQYEIRRDGVVDYTSAGVIRIGGRCFCSLTVDYLSVSV